MQLYPPRWARVISTFLFEKAAWTCATFLRVEGSLVTGRLLMTLNPSFSRFFTPAMKSFFFLISQLGVIVYTAFNQPSIKLNPVRNSSRSTQRLSTGGALFLTG